jgi:methylmalonyl-CoA mutase cobalamin-binding domain/chain
VGHGSSGKFRLKGRDFNDAGIFMKPLRILCADIGDEHAGRESKNLAKLLRDAGFEVIPLGFGFSAGEIALAARQEDVDALCLWCASGCDIEMQKSYLSISNAELLESVPVFLCGMSAHDFTSVKWHGSVPIIFKKDDSLSTIAERISHELKKPKRS